MNVAFWGKPAFVKALPALFGGIGSASGAGSKTTPAQQAPLKLVLDPGRRREAQATIKPRGISLQILFHCFNQLFQREGLGQEPEVAFRQIFRESLFRIARNENHLRLDAAFA
jgi:hypothetical protein